MIDQQTANRAYPLPHPDNMMDEDVTRIKDSFEKIDLDVNDLYETTTSLSTDITGYTQNAQSGTYLHALSTGSGAAYEVSLSPVPTALTAGRVIYMKAHTQNTGPATLDVNGLGPKAIKKIDGSDLRVKEIYADAVCFLFYDGTNFQLINPRADSEQIDIVTSNLMAAFEEIQESHGGFLAMEAGWSDSFANANEQGADETNSSEYLYDAANTLYKGSDPGTGLNSDKDYNIEINYQQQEWTNSNQSTSQATIASGTTVTLSSGVWPTNCASGRISFNSGSTWFDISNRDSDTQLTLSNAASDGSFNYSIRLTNFLTTSPTNLCLGQTYHASSENGGNVKENSFSGNTSDHWYGNTFETGWIACQFFTPKTITKIRVHNGEVHANNKFKDWTLYGSNSSPGTGGTVITTGQHPNQTNAWEEYNFSNSTAYTYYTFSIENQWIAGYYTLVSELEMMESDGTNQLQFNRFEGEIIDSATKLLLHMNGSNGSATFTDSSQFGHGITVTGNAHIDTSISKFSGACASFDGSDDYLTITDNGDFDFPGDYTIDFWYNVTSSASGCFYCHHQGGYANHGIFINRGGAGTISIQDDVNGHYQHYGSGLNDGKWHHVAWVRNGSGSNNNTIYIDGSSIATFTATSAISINTDIVIGYYYLVPGLSLNGYMDEFRISKDIARWTSNFTPPSIPYGSSIPISEYVSVCDSETQKTDTSAWSDVNSGSVTETLNAQNTYYWLSFNSSADFGDGTEIKIFNPTDSVWRVIAKNNASSWEYNNDNSNSATYTGATATVNDMLHAVSQAIATQDGNRMTGTNLAAVTDTQWEETGGWSTSVSSIVRGTTLYSNNSSQNPSVVQYQLNYDSGRQPMDLKSKAYDPGFIPSEAYIWARAEHSDADGSGTFSVSRNGGSEWETVSMIQQGLSFNDIRIMRGTIGLSGQTSGQDLRCRYETASAKDQYLHSWGLQAKS